MTQRKESLGYRGLLRLLEDPTLTPEQKTKLGCQISRIELEKEKRAVAIARGRGKKVAQAIRAAKDNPERFRP